MSSEERDYERWEVAELFDVSESTVDRWRYSRKIPTVPTPGGQHRYPREWVDAYLAAQRQARLQGKEKIPA